jgi:hypothetical protein
MSPVLLMGLPDSGKTNFLARTWIALTEKGCAVKPHGTPKDIAYVESLVQHLLQGRFAPRSNQNEEPRPFTLEVTDPSSGKVMPLMVPDVRGELWKGAVLNSELPEEWMGRLHSCNAVLLLLRVHSPDIVKPLDWVASKRSMEHQADDPSDANNTPTQVMLCELLRLLEIALTRKDGVPPRVAVLVTAWDLLSSVEQADGPEHYIQQQFPMLAGRLRDITKLEIAVFGVSILGGDLVEDQQFQEEFLASNSIQGRGFIVHRANGELQHSNDLTSPLAWCIRAK